MAKTVSLLVAAAAIALIAFLSLRGEELFSIANLAKPALPAIPAMPTMPQGGHAAKANLDPGAEGVTDVQGPAPAAPPIQYGPEPKFKSDPTTMSVPKGKLIAGKSPIDPEKMKQYEEALAELQINGCNSNGSFTIQTRKQRTPRTLHAGEPIEFTNGLLLTGRMTGYPDCRVTLFDHDQRVAELSSF